MYNYSNYTGIPLLPFVYKIITVMLLNRTYLYYSIISDLYIIIGYIQKRKYHIRLNLQFLLQFCWIYYTFINFFVLSFLITFDDSRGKRYTVYNGNQKHQFICIYFVFLVLCQKLLDIPLYRTLSILIGSNSLLQFFIFFVYVCKYFTLINWISVFC